MQKATFKLLRKDGTPAGRAVFFGKSQKAAQASGERYLNRIGIRSEKARNVKKSRNAHRKRRFLNFGQRMARLRRRKRK